MPSITIYNDALAEILKGTIDLDTDTLKFALVTSAYTPSDDHTQWADASAAEVANGSGYTTGGATLTNVTATRAGNVTKLDADDVTFAALTKTFRYGVLYANVTRNGKTNPLIARVLFDTTPGDVSVAGINYSAQWSASGILTLTK